MIEKMREQVLKNSKETMVLKPEAKKQEDVRHMGPQEGIRRPLQ